MESAIVTVKSCMSVASYDVEVPTNIACEILAGRIAALLRAHDGSFIEQSDRYQLKVEQLGRFLQGNESFADAGVWDGSAITLVAG